MHAKWVYQVCISKVAIAAGGDRPLRLCRMIVTGSAAGHGREDEKRWSSCGRETSHRSWGGGNTVMMSIKNVEVGLWSDRVVR